MAVGPTHPEARWLAEALLTEAVGAEVREEWEKGARPRCRCRTAVDAPSAA